MPEEWRNLTLEGDGRTDRCGGWGPGATVARMRMFVAITPPEDALEDLAEFLAPRQDSAPGFRWSAQEEWHVTMAFMPQVVERHLDDLLAGLERAAARRTPFALALAGGGAFPDAAKAKVLYVALDLGSARAELDRLAAGVRSAANNVGAGTEGRKFQPHLTLARLGRSAEVTKWIRVLDSYRGPTWRAYQVTLIESHLGEGPRRRPRYEVLESFPLRGAGQVLHNGTEWPPPVT